MNEKSLEVGDINSLEMQLQSMYQKLLPNR